ncbi:MAG: hypothetical protein HONBIEJF_03023 [Fimbriimonadaceae bacterium]|nr:hypothetical protein [Fimbriimonadaceae bacterium]
MPLSRYSVEAHEFAAELRDFIEKDAARLGRDTTPVDPGPRVAFRWPPHPVSADFHVLTSDWTGTATLQYRDESFPVELAQTPEGHFARCPTLWSEAMAFTSQDSLDNLLEVSKPLLDRQWLIGEMLGCGKRFTDRISVLGPAQLLKLLYCSDRDVANDARQEIETHASLRVFGPALISIIDDRVHPYRRSAQWCALDLFEDLPGYCDDPAEQRFAIASIKGLLMDAPDDYARTMFKAGVVLGGHVANDMAADALLEVLDAPSPIGRRAAIHGLFHLCEWLPDRKPEVVTSLQRVAADDTEPLLRAYADGIRRDIERGDVEHVMEPIFPNER